LLPKLNSPLRIDPSSGEVASDVVASIEEICENALEVMRKADELSGYKVVVSPVLEDDTVTPGQKKLIITEQIVPFGSADIIENNIGFVVKISS
jgi:hypothetical protein